MLIKDSFPFKKTLHLPTRDSRRLLTSPFEIKAFIEDTGCECPKISYMLMEVPSLSSVVGIELRRIELVLSDNLNGNLTVYLQHLDGKGRPSGEPLALFSAEDNITSNYQLKIPLQGGEKVQLLFACNIAMHKNIVRTILISGVCMLVPGRVQLSKADGKKINIWTSNNWLFKAGDGSLIVVDESKSGDLVLTSRKRDRSPSDEAPQLTHSFVVGGDDES